MPCRFRFAQEENKAQRAECCFSLSTGIPYKIHVTTSDISQAGTSARVFLIMYGGKVSRGVILKRGC